MVSVYVCVFVCVLCVKKEKERKRERNKQNEGPPKRFLCCAMSTAGRADDFFKLRK